MRKKPLLDGCPHCGYRQICPCDGPACKTKRERTGLQPWKVDREKSLITCFNCGFTAHIDVWEEYFREIGHIIPLIVGSTDRERAEMFRNAAEKIRAKGGFIRV